MDFSKLQDQLMDTFRAELTDRVAAFGADLLDLEKGPEPSARVECLASLFREAHSLKGAARSVGVAQIEAACHEAESVLAGMRDGRFEISKKWLGLLFDFLDAIQDANTRLRERRPLEGGPLDDLSRTLRDALSGNEPSTKTAPHNQAALVSTPQPTAAIGDARPQATHDTLRVRVDRLDEAITQYLQLTSIRATAQKWPQEIQHLKRAIRANGNRVKKAGSKQNGELTNAWIDEGLDRLSLSIAAAVRRFETTVSNTVDALMSLRMTPFSEACEGLALLVRNSSTIRGKAVRLVVEGGTIEVDRSVIEGIRDPLVHLVRNAVEHGIELPATRRAQGKPEEGVVSLTAELKGNRVAVSVRDDGRGVDLVSIRSRAAELGWAAPTTDTDAMNLIFSPGFSTARELSAESGRGVGLDVVKIQVESLHGSVSVNSNPISGTEFTLNLPLTLLTMQGLVVEASAAVFVLLESAVASVTRAKTSDLQIVGGRQVLWFDNHYVPVHNLCHVLGIESATNAADSNVVHAVVVGIDNNQVAFAVDNIVGVQSILVRPLDPRLGKLSIAIGTTECADGRLGLVLNAPALTAQAGSRQNTLVSSAAEPELAQAKKRVLLADDSITTRSLLKSLLEEAGYAVTTAVDGNEAWKRLQDAGFDIVVSDVEMPECSGFDLVERMRSTQGFQDLPVILLTGLESEADRRKGLNLGANAYLVKSTFDQRELVQTIEQLC